MTVNERASRLHALPKIQARVEELSAQIASQAAQDFKIDAAYVMKRISEIDQMDAADILDASGDVLPISLWPKVWRQFISGFDVMEITQGGDKALAVIKKIKWPDKIKNLEMMGKLATVAAFKEIKEHTGPGGGPIQTTVATLTQEQAMKLLSDLDS